jgi:hypothetical protein
MNMNLNVLFEGLGRTEAVLLSVESDPELPIPIAVFDKFGVLLMKAGAIPADIEGSVWEEVMAHSRFTPDSISRSQLRAIDETTLTNERPIRYLSEKHHENHIGCGIFIADQLYALLCAASARRSQTVRQHCSGRSST